MGLFGGGPSLREIDDFSLARIEERIGEAQQTGRFERWQFEALLKDLRDYGSRHKLSLWKRSRFLGILEVFLSKIVTKQEREFLMNMARQDLVDRK